MAEERLAEVRSDFAAFEQAAGVSLGGWHLDRVVDLGRKAKQLLRHDDEFARAREHLINARATLESGVVYLKGAIAAIDDKED